MKGTHKLSLPFSKLLVLNYIEIFKVIIKITD